MIKYFMKIFKIMNTNILDYTNITLIDILLLIWIILCTNISCFVLFKVMFSKIIIKKIFARLKSKNHVNMQIYVYYI